MKDYREFLEKQDIKRKKQNNLMWIILVASLLIISFAILYTCANEYAESQRIPINEVSL